MTSRTTQPVSWWNSKLSSKAVGTIGFGVFAEEVIPEGQVLAVWGGRIITTEERNTLPEVVERYTVQVESDLHLMCTVEEAGVAENFNHSCTPNAGIQGQIVLVALRTIQPGEHVCFDYAMSESDPNFQMTCECKSPNCRHLVTGNDWKNPELQERYRNYFSTYIQRIIDIGIKE
jgi:hypothetical protein